MKTTIETKLTTKILETTTKGLEMAIKRHKVTTAKHRDPKKRTKTTSTDSKRPERQKLYFKETQNDHKETKSHCKVT